VFQFPTGAVGVSSDAQGWSGAGTFTAVVETDALDGELSLFAASNGLRATVASTP
jgi:hypothetical protein